VVLNTSFNENEPIVETAEQALDCFLRTRMDAIVVNNTVIRRQPARREPWRRARERAAPVGRLLHRFYWPDVAAAGQMLTDLAEDLAARGWQVTVVSAAPATRPGWRCSSPRRRCTTACASIRVKTTRFGRGRLVARLGDHASYLGGALLRLLRLPRPDLVVAMSAAPPAAGGGPARRAPARRRDGVLRCRTSTRHLAGSWAFSASGGSPTARSPG
jgi:hypothetical protein